MKLEKNYYLSFMDVLVKHCPDGSLFHQVFGKKTHTNHYLHALSYYHLTHKYVILKTLFTKANSIYDPSYLKKNHI